MELRSFGLKSIKVGSIPDDGSMGTVLAPLGLTYQDSASLKEADPAVTDIFSEEEDFAVESFQDIGQVLLAFSIMDYTPEVLQILKGGTVVVVGGKSQWQSPAAVVNIEKSVQIITKRDLLIEIPRTQMRAVINASLKKKGISLIDVKAPVLLPNYPGLSPLAICQYQPPVVNAGVDQVPAAAVIIANLVGTAAAFRGTLTYLWTVKSVPVGAAVPVMATPAALANAVTVLTTHGVYVFTLTATDSNGYTSSDDVQVTTS
jgi:hypothetical protein